MSDDFAADIAMMYGVDHGSEDSVSSTTVSYTRAINPIYTMGSDTPINIPGRTVISGPAETVVASGLDNWQPYHSHVSNLPPLAEWPIYRGPVPAPPSTLLPPNSVVTPISEVREAIAALTTGQLADMRSTIASWRTQYTSGLIVERVDNPLPEPEPKPKPKFFPRPKVSRWANILVGSNA